jgi:hypothetical protein
MFKGAGGRNMLGKMEYDTIREELKEKAGRTSK